MLLRNIYIIFILLVFQSSINAQNNFFSRLNIGATVDYGYIYWHTDKIRHLSQAHFNINEISLLYSTIGNDEFSKLYNHPVIGLSYIYTNLGHNNILGNAKALLPLVYFPLTNNRHFNIVFKTALGMGYISKPYNRLLNHKNNAIGTHINIAANIAYDLFWTVNERIKIKTEFGLTHFSNGAIKMPNLGINIPSVGLGFLLKINNTNIIYETQKQFFDTTINKRINYTIIGTYAIAEISRPDGLKYDAYSLSFNASKELNLKHDFGIGLDLFYNNSNLFRLNQEAITVKNKLEIIRSGFSVLYDFKFDKMKFFAQMGYYIYAKDKNDGYIYHRFGLGYLINKHFILNLSLKTHFIRAEGIEWGGGYKF
jgi:hypothetical protein